jgi:MFS family permease
MWMPSPVEVRRPIMAAIGFSAIFIGDIPSGQPRITYFVLQSCGDSTRQETTRDQTMNSPSRVIGFVNAAHFIDHYAMLIFAAAVIIMGPAFGMAYSELLPYATPGFVAFGAGSLITGWLGDRWSRRHMMVIFFAGIGASMIAVGFAQTPLQLGAVLLSIGLFASIYHPVGTAMIVSYADKLGREMGLNGVWGNLGVASSALVTGVIGQYLGWRWAFIVPGVVTMLIGVAFAMLVVHEDRTGSRQAAAQARIAKQDMWRVILALLIVVIAISTTFNAVTVALPKLFAERLADLTASPALLGVIAAGVYVFGAMTQYTIGKLIDHYSLKTVMLPLSFLLAPFLYFAATLSNLPLIIASIGIVMGAFGQVTVNDAMVGKYTTDEWRSRAYSVRYFIGFTAAGASVGLVAWLYDKGGFVTMLQTFGALCLLVIVAAIILPQEIKVPAARTAP